jgi:hypothetical protein
MKYALVEEQRREAEPGLLGMCPGCRSEMVAKCGNIRVWHWSHRGNRTCDHWWEPETAWHRDWKNHFPVEWQEFFHRASDGEKHVADIKTERGWVIEFQHSHLAAVERRTREGFYEPIVWVVDGRRRKRDWMQFERAIKEGSRYCEKPAVWLVWIDECTLLKEWAESRVHVFFDFGAAELYCMLPGSTDGRAAIMIASKADFIESHIRGTYNFLLRADLKRSKTTDLRYAAAGFRRLLARKARPRARFRF